MAGEVAFQRSGHPGIFLPPLPASSASTAGAASDAIISSTTQTTRACFQSYREFGTRRLSDSHTTDDEGAATTQTPPLPQWSRHCLEAAWPFPQRYEHGARPPVRTLQG